MPKKGAKKQTKYAKKRISPKAIRKAKKARRKSPKATKRGKATKAPVPKLLKKASPKAKKRGVMAVQAYKMQSSVQCEKTKDGQICVEKHQQCSLDPKTNNWVCDN